MQVTWRESFFLPSNLSITLNPFHSLNERIKHIKERHLTVADVNDLKKSFTIYRWKIFSLFHTAEALKGVDQKAMQQFFAIIAEKEDVSSYIQMYASLFNENELQMILNQSKEDLKAQIEVFTLLQKDPLFQNVLTKEAKVIFQDFVESSIYFTHHLIEMVMGMLGLNELNVQENSLINKYISKERLKTYQKLFSTPFWIFQFFALYFHSLPAAALAGFASFSIPVLCLIYNKYLKPCQRVYAGLENLKNREMETICPRPDILRAIQNAFDMGSGALLVGDPGVGKTLIVQSLGQEMRQKRFSSLIKNPQIFGCNASDFKTHLSFDNIKQTFLPYKNEVIFFFDEFAAFFKPNVVGNTSEDQLKTFNFNYVIGATTTEEFDKYIKGNKTIEERRFQVIHVPQMEDQEIEMTLHYILRHDYAGLDVEEGVLAHIVQEAKVLKKARSLLKLAAKKMITLPADQASLDLAALQKEVSFLATKVDQRVPGAAAEYLKIQEKITKIEKKQEEKKEKFKSIERLEKSYLQLKTRRYQLIFPDMNKNAREAWLKNEVAVKMVQKLIKEARLQLNLPLNLNKALIDSIK